MLEAARALGESETVRVERRPCSRSTLCRPNSRSAARSSSRLAIEIDPPGRRGAGAGDARSTPFARGSASRPTRSRALFEAADEHGLRVKLHAEQLSNLDGAALAADYGALSADHLEHADEAGVAAMARARHGRGAASRRLLRAEGDAEAAGRPAAPLRRADGGRDRLQSRHLAGPLADPDDEHGLHPVRPDPGGGAGRHDPRRRPGAGPARRRSARSAPARPPTSASGGSAGRPSFATGSACRGPSGGSWRARMRLRSSSRAKSSVAQAGHHARPSTSLGHATRMTLRRRTCITDATTAAISRPAPGPRSAARSWATEAAMRMLHEQSRSAASPRRRRSWSSMAASAGRRATGRATTRSSRRSSGSRRTRPCSSSRASRSACSAPTRTRRGC